MIKSRLILTILLFLACVMSTILLATAPPIKVQTITTEAEVDSLIELAFSDYGITRSQYRSQALAIDTSFSRKIYRMNVPEEFSKTSFHLRLQKAISPYGLEVPAKIYFPDEDMHIHILYNDTVWRTIRITTNNN
jgi:hypothetical protein